MVCVEISIHILVELGLPLEFTNLTTILHYFISHGIGSGLELALRKGGWRSCNSINEPLAVPL